VLQLAHFSVKGYLTSNRVQHAFALEFQGRTASASIARVCLAYLLQFDRELPPKEARIEFPLAQYAAQSWMNKAAVAEDEDKDLQRLIVHLLCDQGTPYQMCNTLYRPDQPWQPWEDFNKGRTDAPASPLYYAAFTGLRTTVKLLLEKKADVNAQGGHYGNALQAASFRGHEQVVKLLLEKKADVNAQGGRYGNALQAASVGGHEQVGWLVGIHFTSS
jgi:hypothetical protein